MASNESKNKHMDFEMRQDILIGIREKKKLKKIAEQIGKDPTTISKEIKKHRYSKVVVKQGEKPNRCAEKKRCKRKNVCCSCGM